MAAGVSAVGSAVSQSRKGRGRAQCERRSRSVTAAPAEVLSQCRKSEDGIQRIAVDRELIRINRRIAGLETWVNVPTISYRGVTLRPCGETGQLEIVLLHIDPSLELVLSRTSDDTDIIALWRRYATTLDLPLLVEDSEGRLQSVSQNMDCGPYQRRSGSPLKMRRPRFLSRRRVGRMGEQPIHHGETELFGSSRFGLMPALA